MQTIWINLKNMTLNERRDKIIHFMVAESIKKSKGIFIKVRLTVISNGGRRGLNQER